jgi:hypothetical protein
MSIHRGRKKGGGGMSTHGEGGRGAGMGGKGINNREDPGGERVAVAKKKLTMGVVIYDIDVPIHC